MESPDFTVLIEQRTLFLDETPTLIHVEAYTCNGDLCVISVRSKGLGVATACIHFEDEKFQTHEIYLAVPKSNTYSGIVSVDEAVLTRSRILRYLHNKGYRRARDYDISAGNGKFMAAFELHCEQL